MIKCTSAVEKALFPLWTWLNMPSLNKAYWFLLLKRNPSFFFAFFFSFFLVTLHLMEIIDCKNTAIISTKGCEISGKQALIALFYISIPQCCSISSSNSFQLKFGMPEVKHVTGVVIEQGNKAQRCPFSFSLV